MNEIAKLLDSLTPRQFEQLLYEAEKRGLVNMKAVSLEEYRRDALRTYPYELTRNERRDYAAMKLAEEAAEFMAAVNKSQYQGEPYSRERIRDELGDVLWALMVNLTEYGLTLDQIMLANMAKRRARYPEGV